MLSTAFTLGASTTSRASEERLWLSLAFANYGVASNSSLTRKFLQYHFISYDVFNTAVGGYRRGTAVRRDAPRGACAARARSVVGRALHRKGMFRAPGDALHCWNRHPRRHGWRSGFASNATGSRCWHANHRHHQRIRSLHVPRVEQHRVRPDTESL